MIFERIQTVIAVVRAAESIRDATGEQKKTAAMEMLRIAIIAAEIVAGRELVLDELVRDTFSKAIDAVVAFGNLHRDIETPRSANENMVRVQTGE